MVNKFAIVPTSLPVQQPTSTSRLEAAYNILAEMKNSPIAFATLMLTNFLAVLPAFMRFQLATDIYTKHSTLFSNVAGPEEQVSIFGQKITKMMGAFPNFVHQLIFMSYAGTVYGTICVDSDVIDDPELVKSCFMDELKDLQAAVAEEQKNGVE